MTLPLTVMEGKNAPKSMALKLGIKRNEPPSNLVPINRTPPLYRQGEHTMGLDCLSAEGMRYA